jgi:hypothetical protein
VSVNVWGKKKCTIEAVCCPVEAGAQVVHKPPVKRMIKLPLNKGRNGDGLSRMLFSNSASEVAGLSEIWTLGFKPNKI